MRASERPRAAAETGRDRCARPPRGGRPSRHLSHPRPACAPPIPAASPRRGAPEPSARCGERGRSWGRGAALNPCAPARPRAPRTAPDAPGRRARPGGGGRLRPAGTQSSAGWGPAPGSISKGGHSGVARGFGDFCLFIFCFLHRQQRIHFPVQKTQAPQPAAARVRLQASGCRSSFGRGLQSRNGTRAVAKLSDGWPK